MHLCVSWFPDLCTALPKAEVVSSWVLALPSLKSVLLSLMAVLEFSRKHSPSHSPLLFPTVRRTPPHLRSGRGRHFRKERIKVETHQRGWWVWWDTAAVWVPSTAYLRGRQEEGCDVRHASTALQAPGLRRARGPSSSQEISWFPVWLKSFLSFSQHLFLLQNLSLITYHYSHSHDFFLPKQRFRLSVVPFVPTCGLFYPLHLILLFGICGFFMSSAPLGFSFRLNSMDGWNVRSIPNQWHSPLPASARTHTYAHTHAHIPSVYLGL